MRVVIKGGVWRNSEDEILKAAISKYGKNQWARISSLLVRKTPKQCKARWYEWLDPSIKKTEWSKEEDEKLLHLAKLMPTQWRTIAPIVGRTANQCLDRYQKLLDDAEQRDNEDFGLTGTGAEAGPSADDVRRLRPGEVDPDPENKPARPDPIDMDEDEKEMLSEARARLANTQGKKAKRKARERQLEEARRLAMLQKKRELKAAGIQTRFKVKQKGMDYNADIPFEKQPAPGFYDVTEEENKRTRAPIGKTVRELDGHKKKDVDDEEIRKKQKKAKEATAKAQQGGAMANFVPAKEQQIQRLKEEQQISKRRKLALPEAQVGDQELEEIVKIGQAGEAARLAAGEGGNEAGRGLLGEYSALAHAKDTRTPRTAPQSDNVMAEARNLRNMSMQQTPLLGDENTPLHELANRGTGFEGATPARSVAPTPNPLATPRDQASNVGATPRGVPGSVRGPGATPMRTPRDSLAINTPYGETPVQGTPREQKLRQRNTKSALEQAFAALPKPKNDFELVVPEDDDNESDAMQTDEPMSAEDAADRDARIATRKAEEKRKMLARRTQAVKRDLPRPVEFDPSSLLYDLQSAEEGTPEQELERLVAMEMVRLLEHDAIAHPVPGGKLAGGRQSTLERIDDADLDKARQAVNVELATELGFPGAKEEVVKRTLISQIDLSVYDTTWKPTVESLAYDASTNSYVDKSTLNKKEAAKGQAALLDMFKQRMTADAAKAAKQEKKLSTVLGGYQARFKALSTKLSSIYEQVDDSILALENFRMLAHSEEAAIPRRLEILTKEVRDLERREREGQIKYSEMSREKAELEQKVSDLEMDYAEAVNEQALGAMDES